MGISKKSKYKDSLVGLIKNIANRIGKNNFLNIRNINILFVYIFAGALITIGYLGNFPKSEKLLGWLGSLEILKWTPLSDIYGSYNINPAYLGLTFFPVLLLIYIITNEAMLSHVDNVKDELSLKMKRGQQKRRVLSTFALNTSFIAIIGIIVGFVLAKLIINARLDYVKSVFINDKIIYQYYSLDLYENLTNFGIIVIISGLSFLFISFRHILPYLLLSRHRIEPNPDEQEKNLSKNFLKYFFLVFVSTFLLFELIQLNTVTDHPFIIIIILVSIVALLYSTDKLFLLILKLMFSYKPDKGENIPEGVYDVLIKGNRYFAFFCARMGLPILILMLIYFYSANHNLKELLYLLLLVFLIIGLVLLLFNILPTTEILHNVQRIKWLKKFKNRKKSGVSFTFFTLLFILLIWQNAIYATISQNAIDDSYYLNYGADIRISPNSGRMNFYGYNGNESDIIESIDERITSALRYYVNIKHSVAPKTQDYIDIIMFDPVKYLENDYLLKDEWFEGGTAKELFNKLNDSSLEANCEDEVCGVILDANLASSSRKNIGDEIVFRPIYDHLDSRGTTRINYRFKIIGLVNHFPGGENQEYSTDDPSIYRPFAILPINLATADFQYPPFEGIHQPDRGLTTYFLLKTETGSNLQDVMDKVLESQLFSRPDSETIAYSIRNSFFIQQTHRYQQITGVAQLVIFILLITLGPNLLLEWYLEEEESPESRIYHHIGLKKSDFLITRFLDQILLISLSIILGILLGSLITQTLGNLLLPRTSTPIYIVYTNYSPALAGYIYLIGFSMVLFYLKNKGRLKDLRKAILQTKIIGIIVLLVLSVIALPIENFLFKLKIFTTNNFTIALIIIIVFIFILFWKNNSAYVSRFLINVKSTFTSNRSARVLLGFEPFFSLSFSIGVGVLLFSIFSFFFPKQFIDFYPIIYFLICLSVVFTFVIIIIEQKIVLNKMENTSQKLILMSIIGDAI
ncbi:MAG: hypothetical protein ACXAC7_14580, partial [Candidatus Hodarchaeales archaeon]